MIPPLTTTPNRIINPVRVLRFIKLLPVRIRAAKEPIAAKGIATIKTSGMVSDSNTEANIIKIRSTEAKIRNLNSAKASSFTSRSITTPLAIGYSAISASISAS